MKVSLKSPSDANDYLIELWDKKNEKHPAVCVLLGGQQLVVLYGDPDQSDHNSICPYSVKSIQIPNRVALKLRWGNKIIIGSGLDTANS